MSRKGYGSRETEFWGINIGHTTTVLQDTVTAQPEMSNSDYKILQDAGAAF